MRKFIIQLFILKIDVENHDVIWKVEEFMRIFKNVVITSTGVDSTSIHLIYVLRNNKEILRMRLSKNNKPPHKDNVRTQIRSST